MNHKTAENTPERCWKKHGINKWKVAVYLLNDGPWTYMFSAAAAWNNLQAELQRQELIPIRNFENVLNGMEADSIGVSNYFPFKLINIYLVRWILSRMHFLKL